MGRKSMLRALCALTVAGCAAAGPVMSSSAAATTAAWVDQPADSAPLSPSFPQEFSSSTMAYDSALHTAMLVADDPSGFEVWISAGSGWSHLGQAPAAQYFDVAYDPVHKVNVAVGGCPGHSGDLCTWTWGGGTTWTPVAAGGLGQTVAVALAYDPGLGGTVLLAVGSSGSAVTYLRDHSAWEVIATQGPSSVTSPRGGMAWDAARGELLFGLAPLGAQVQTWVLRGTTWVRLFPVTVPDPNSGSPGSLAYDPAEGVVVMVFPRTVATAGGDTWTWDGSNWQSVNDVQTMEAVNFVNLTGNSCGICAITYDTTRHAVIGLDDFGLDLDVVGDEAVTAVYTPLL